MLYQRLIRPILFQLDPEQAHRLVFRLALAMHSFWPLLAPALRYAGADLRTSLAGVEIANPVGLAAGFDKNGLLVSVLGELGFGFAEVGSVTARASAGNPRPRLFRLPADEALINRLGLNNDGADALAGRLRKSRFSLPVGLNIAKTNDPSITGEAAVEDMLYTFRQVKDLPVSYVTVNVSCPNTPEGITQESRAVSEVLSGMMSLNSRGLPVLVKLSPDSSAGFLEEIVECATRCGARGFVCGNTSTTRADLRTPPAVVSGAGPGGLSGRPLKPLALALCRQVARLKAPEQVIVGAGGISSGQDAYDFIRAGASAVQIYTALVYHGPALPRRINEELAGLLARDRLTLGQAVGCLI